MVTDFIKGPAFEIARRVEVRQSYAWFVVLECNTDPCPEFSRGRRGRLVFVQAESASATATARR
jgi:hypothetical protein